MKNLYIIRDSNYSDVKFAEKFSEINKKILKENLCLDGSVLETAIGKIVDESTVVYFTERKTVKMVSALYKIFKQRSSSFIIVSDLNPDSLPDELKNYPSIITVEKKEFSPKALTSFLNLFSKANRHDNNVEASISPEFNISLERIFENKGVGVTLADFSGKIFKCNKAFCSLLMYSENEIYNKRFIDLTYEDDIKEAENLYDQLVKGKREHYSVEKRYVRKDGKIIWCDLTVALIKDNESNNIYTLGLSVDISARKEIEQKLKVEENFSLTLMNNTTDSVYFKDLESKFIKVNKTALRKFGLKNESRIIGKSDFDFFSVEHAQKAYNDEQKIIKSGKALIGIEEKEIWEDGKITYVSTTKLPLKDPAGNIIGTFGITRDITKQKVAEINLAKEKERAELIYRLIPSAIFTVDNDKIITGWNERAEEITGFKYKEVIGQHCSKIAYEPCETVCGLWNNDHPKPILGQRCKIRTKDGRILSVSKNVDFMKDENGKIVGGIESFEDITSKVELERIQNAQFQISEAMHSTPDITTLYKKIHDVVRGLMDAENFYIALYDDKEEIISFPYFVDEFDETPAPRKLKRGLTEYVLKTGKEILVDKEKDKELTEKGEVELMGEMQSIWLGVPLKIEDKVIGVMAVQDYTNENIYGEKERQILLFVSEQIAIAIDRKRYHDELKKYSEELNQLNITKDKFFSIIAHDLKNPFITLLGFSDMLLHEFDDLTEEEKLTYISDIRNSAKLSHELLENLLDWSRSQTGKISYEPHLFDIHELVKRNVLLLDPMAKSKSIHLICEVDPNNIVYADYEMINTVIRNLISNAVKFTNPDGEIRIYIINNESELSLYVKDNGVGMNKKTLNKLFMLGEQHTTKGTSEEKGTGLGLILCKEFVENNRGRISAESELGKGTTFCFTLPTSQPK